MSQQTATDLSVVILCYKAGTLVRTIARRMEGLLKERGINYELILVANYNKGEELSDLTPAIVKELAGVNPRIVALTEEKQGMFGWDVKSGLRASSGKLIAFIDGDGQMPLEDIVRLFDVTKKTGADMAQTFRVKRFDGMERIFISRVYNFFLKALFPEVRIFDANAKPKIFTRKAYTSFDLRSDDWFIDAEIVIQAARAGMHIEQIPTVFLKNPERKSFVRIKDIFQFLRNLVHYRFFDPETRSTSR